MKGLVFRRRLRAKKVHLVCRLCGTQRPARQQIRHRGRCRICASFGD